VPGLDEAGARHFAITPQIISNNKEQLDERGFPFSLLHDDGNAFATSLDLVHTLQEELRAAYLQFGIDLPASNGDESWTLPMPARYIVDATGIVRHASVHADYTKRPEPDETLELVRAL
jgi:peroxiredoxin